MQVLEGGYLKEEDTQQTQFEVSLASLRVLRRVITLGGAEVAASFSQIGGTACLVWYLESVAATEDPLPLLALEAVRTIVGALAVGEGDDPEQYLSVDDQLDAMEAGKKKAGGGLFGKKKGPDEVLPPLVKPETPRGYEVIGMDANDIGSVVRSLITLCQTQSLNRNLRFMRCALGFFSYIAAENIPGAETVLFDNSTGLADLLTKTFEEIGASREVVILVRLR